LSQSGPLPLLCLRRQPVAASAALRADVSSLETDLNCPMFTLISQS